MRNHYAQDAMVMRTSITRAPRGRGHDGPARSRAARRSAG